MNPWSLRKVQAEKLKKFQHFRSRIQTVKSGSAAWSSEYAMIAWAKQLLSFIWVDMQRTLPPMCDNFPVWQKGKIRPELSSSDDFWTKMDSFYWQQIVSSLRVSTWNKKESEGAFLYLCQRVLSPCQSCLWWTTCKKQRKKWIWTDFHLFSSFQGVFLCLWAQACKRHFSFKKIFVVCSSWNCLSSCTKPLQTCYLGEEKQSSEEQVELIACTTDLESPQKLRKEVLHSLDHHWADQLKQNWECRERSVWTAGWCYFQWLWWSEEMARSPFPASDSPFLPMYSGNIFVNDESGFPCRVR